MRSIKALLKWLLFPQQSMGEVFVVFVLCLVSVPFSSFWPNDLSVAIAAALLLFGVYIIGKSYFFKNKSDLSALELKTFQFVGMIMVFAIMIQYFGWFRGEGISYSLTGLNKTVTILFGLLLSFRALLAIIAVCLVAFGSKVKVDVMIGLGLLYFANLPDITFNRSNRALTIVGTIICLVVYYFTRSLPEALIYSSLALDAGTIVIPYLVPKARKRS